MYQPPIFREERIEVMHQLMRAHPFATLVSLQDGALSADHLPLALVEETGSPGRLRGHVAKGNPLWSAGMGDNEALAIFQGPQAYVTPSWYPSKSEHGKVVPTWNYAIVHARGTLSFHSDPSWLLDHLVNLTGKQESTRPSPWQVSDAPDEYIERQLKGIVGVELEVTSLEGKWKVSQNKDEQDRSGVVSGLQQEGTREAEAVANLVSDRL